MCVVSSVSTESEAGGGGVVLLSLPCGPARPGAWTCHSPSPHRTPHTFPEGAGSRTGRMGCQPLKCYCPIVHCLLMKTVVAASPPLFFTVSVHYVRMFRSPSISSNLFFGVL